MANINATLILSVKIIINNNYNLKQHILKLYYIIWECAAIIVLQLYNIIWELNYSKF